MPRNRWAEAAQALQMLGQQFDDPVRTAAAQSGLSLEEFKRLQAEAARQKAIQDAANVEQTRASTESTRQSANATSLANEKAEALLRMMSGGMEAGEKRSLYKPLAIGEENPLPDRPIQRDVGEEDRPDAIARFSGKEYKYKQIQDLLSNALDERKVRVSEKNSAISEADQDRKQQQLELNKKYTAAYVQKVGADIARMAKEKTKLTPAQTASLAEKFTTEELKWAEEDISPQQRLDKWNEYYDMIQGALNPLQEKKDIDEKFTGEGTMQEVPGGMGAFEDEQAISDENGMQEQQASEWAKKYHEKRYKGQVEDVAQELEAKRILGMTEQQRAADNSIPLPKVLGLDGEMDKIQLTQDMKRFEAEVRENIIRGIPPEQWSDGAIKFVEAMMQDKDQGAQGTPSTTPPGQ